WFFPLSFGCLMIILVPILMLTLYGAKDLAIFDRSYDVPRSLHYFTSLFIDSKISALLKILIAAAFLCVFLTTVNTWIIGMSQHLARVPGFRAARMFLIIPFASFG